MTAPTYSWVTIPTTDYDPDSPVTSALFTTIIQNLIHVRETVYNPNTHTAAIAHNHDGVNSALISLGGSGVNVIYDSAPTTSGNDNTNNWNHHTTTVDSNGIHLNSNGDYCTHPLWKYALSTAYNSGVGGMMAILADTSDSTGGKLKFGIADGDSGTFITGGGAEIVASDWGATSCIFWTKFTDIGGSWGTAPYMLIKATATPASEFIVKRMWFIPGADTYCWYRPFYYNGRDHDGDECMRNGARVWDPTVNAAATYIIAG